jgi:microcystin degradation protein MlrC
MRVGIVSLMHESNTFIKSPTTLQHFREDLLLEGEAIRQRLADSHHEIGGFFAGLEAAGIAAVPVFAARAIPFGTIEAETFEYLTNRLSNSLAAVNSLDGLLVALHGAAVSEKARDADGQVLRKIREVFGAERPLIMTLDPHANLSQQMVDQCDGITAYRTNPHVDQRERGIEAAELMSRTLRGEIRPVVRAALPSMVINIERQCTSEAHFERIHETANRIRHRPQILSVSLVLGFPYADVEEMGSSTIVIADKDKKLAQSAADELADELWERRQDFVGRFIDIDEAIERAVKLPGPVCLLDMGDNTGGGSPADGTWLAHALLKNRIRSFVCIYDPEAARAAASARANASPIPDEAPVMKVTAKTRAHAKELLAQHRRSPGR